MGAAGSGGAGWAVQGKGWTVGSGVGAGEGTWLRAAWGSESVRALLTWGLLSSCGVDMQEGIMG